jgi:hypothetical protein
MHIHDVCAMPILARTWQYSPHHNVIIMLSISKLGFCSKVLALVTVANMLCTVKTRILVVISNCVAVVSSTTATPQIISILQLKDTIEIFPRRMLNERDSKRRLPIEYSVGDDDWSFLCIAVDVLEPFSCLTKRFESREPRFAEVAASLHYLWDFLHRKRDIYSDGLANLKGASLILLVTPYSLANDQPCN